MIKPVFFNSATVSAQERLVLQAGATSRKEFAVRWALLPETPLGPCLIDTGYSSFVTEGHARSWGLKLYSKLLQPKLLEEGQISSALERYGLTIDDISALIITHFHADHISALRLFDKAHLFMSQSSLDQLLNSSKMCLWLKGIFPELLPSNFIERAIMIEGFKCVEVQGLKTYDLFGTGQCLALPLPGHARGHFGLLFPDEKLLYAVDCAWSLNSFTPDQKSTLLANWINDNVKQSNQSIKSVRDLISCGYQVMLCHEPVKGAYDV